MPEYIPQVNPPAEMFTQAIQQSAQAGAQPTVALAEALKNIAMGYFQGKQQKKEKVEGLATEQRKLGQQKELYTAEHEVPVQPYHVEAAKSLGLSLDPTQTKTMPRDEARVLLERYATMKIAKQNQESRRRQLDEAIKRGDRALLGNLLRTYQMQLSSPEAIGNEAYRLGIEADIAKISDSLRSQVLPNASGIRKPTPSRGQTNLPGLTVE